MGLLFLSLLNGGGDIQGRREKREKALRFGGGDIQMRNEECEDGLPGEMLVGRCYKKATARLAACRTYKQNRAFPG
jgi:hypothetical protein